MKLIIEEFHRNKHNPSEVKALLALAVGHPTIEKLAYLMDEFYVSKGRAIFISSNNGKISGVIGIDYTDRPRGFITHIAVHPDARKKGIASRLINHATTTLELSELEAETDLDAVSFYSACGFETKELESPYAGVRRFRCLRIAAKAVY